MRIAPLLLIGATAFAARGATPDVYRGLPGLAYAPLAQSPQSSQSRASLPAAAPVTFTKDIAPIVFSHCAPCHRPDEIGPFSLLTYRDVRQQATQMASVTASRLMPPWKPRRGVGEFVGARALTDEQIDLIRRWVTEGAVEGNPADLPEPPRWVNGWQFGTPDLIVTMPETYVVRGDGGDVFRTFVIPIPTSVAKYVKAIEFRPGNPRVVHHANLGIDRTRSSRRLDLLDPEPGYVGGMVPDAEYPPGYMLGWTPGQRPRPSPDGMAWRLESGSDLVVQLHLQPDGRPEPVQVSAGFFFTDQPPAQSPIGLRLGSETIEIAAGDSSYAVTDRYVLPVDVDLLAVQPHAHNLARRMEALATLPDGTIRPLIAIDDWDFRWQDVYRYIRPLTLPAGTIVSMRFTYDNSIANPRNPSQPPRSVVWGQNTSDEMGDLWLQLVPRRKADAAALAADIRRKTLAEDLAAYTKVMNADPANPIRHDTVAMLHLQSGHIDEAIGHLRESLGLNADSAPSHYNLGTALSMQRKFDDALAEFRAAVRIDPEYADAHNNLGAMLYLRGRYAEAVDEYTRAIAIRPDNAEAHDNLGRVLSVLGREPESAEQFRLAAQIRQRM